jgi:hypothetical protein
MGLGLAAALGAEVAKEASKAATKEIIKQILLSRVGEKDPVIFFGLFCDFKRLTSFDVTNMEVNAVLERYKPKNQEICFEKQTFKYAVSWQEFKDEELSNPSWEYDALANNNEDEDTNLTIPTESSSGFVLWLVPLSQGNRKETIVSAYIILDDLNRRLLENVRLSIRKITSFGFLRADRKTCLKVDDRLRKKMKKERLVGNTLVESIPNERMLLTVPLRELLTAKAFADSFKLWGVL